MVLTVEDGTGLTNPDSYIALADARDYCATRGMSLNTVDATAEIQLRKAFDYLESLRSTYKGSRTNTTQGGAWPRAEVYIDDVLFDSASIPTALKQAQAQIAAAMERGLDIVPDSDGSPFVSREKVGPIETSYSTRLATSGVPILRSVENLLAPLQNSANLYLSTQRA